jgi:hypothetical protein
MDALLHSRTEPSCMKAYLAISDISLYAVCMRDLEAKPTRFRPFANRGLLAAGILSVSLAAGACHNYNPAADDPKNSLYPFSKPSPSPKVIPERTRKPAPIPSTVTLPTQTPSSISAHTTFITPDMSHYSYPGTPNDCSQGGPRPCAILIRTEPEIKPSNYINANPNQTYVSWPLESYGSTPGHQVAVTCYKSQGQSVTSNDRRLHSQVWYQVIVPAQFILNPDVQTEVRENSPSVSTMQYGGQTAVLGWASSTWFGTEAPNRAVQSCVG